VQPDFDRMRQLSYFFRRERTTVVAGGSVCTQFPEFATQFFGVVCAGGVEIVADVLADFAAGRTLKPIYRSAITRIGDYSVNYGLLKCSGINLKFESTPAGGVAPLQFPLQPLRHPGRGARPRRLQSRRNRQGGGQSNRDQPEIQLSPPIPDRAFRRQQLLR
jgi:hypothetical protein